MSSYVVLVNGLLKLGYAHQKVELTCICLYNAKDREEDQKHWKCLTKLKLHCGLYGKLYDRVSFDHVVDWMPLHMSSASLSSPKRNKMNRKREWYSLGKEALERSIVFHVQTKVSRQYSGGTAG